MTLLAILVGTLVAGIGSVWVAAWLSFGILSRYTQHMLSMAAGALMATSFLHLLPEAFESEAGAHELFLTLLVGLVLGGIYEETDRNNEAKVPGLGDVPGLGWLFKNRDQARRKSELLIFIMPRVMADGPACLPP